MFIKFKFDLDGSFGREEYTIDQKHFALYQLQVDILHCFNASKHSLTFVSSCWEAFE